MGSSRRAIVDDVPPYLRTYNDGSIERFVGCEFAPANFDPETKVSSKDITVRPAGVGARLYRPDSTAKTEKVPVIIYFHGGAFCISSASDPVYHNFLNLLAAKAKVIIVSVDYRLVPEHPLPDVYEDSWSVLQWVVSHTSGNGSEEDWLKENVDFDRTFLAGDSAGANISHHMALRADKSQQPIKFVGLVLVHPYFLGKIPTASEAKDPVGKAMIDKWWTFVSKSDKGCDDPLINPFIDASFQGFACTNRIIVCVAENDILRDRGRLYYESLEKSGWKGKVDLFESKEEGHVFHLFNPKCENARFLINFLADFINYPG